MEYETILEAVELLDQKYLGPEIDVLAKIEEDFANYEFLVDLFGVVNEDEQLIYKYYVGSLNEGISAFGHKIGDMIRSLGAKIGHVKDLLVTLVKQLSEDCYGTLSVITKKSSAMNLNDAVKIVTRFPEVREYVKQAGPAEKEWFEDTWLWLTAKSVNKIKALFGKAGYEGTLKYYKINGSFDKILQGEQKDVDDLVLKIRKTTPGEAILKFFRFLDGILQKWTGKVADIALLSAAKTVAVMGGPKAPKFNLMGKVFWRVRDFLKPTIISARWRRDTESALKAGGKKVYKGLLAAFVPGMAGWLAFAGMAKYIDITRKVILIAEEEK